jgi:hypothetical protein
MNETLYRKRIQYGTQLSKVVYNIRRDRSCDLLGPLMLFLSLESSGANVMALLDLANGH